MAGGGRDVIVTLAEADLAGSAAAVAVTDTVVGFGTLPGAVYVMGLAVLLLSVPHPTPLHPTPDRLQVTAWFAALETVAVNRTVVLMGAVAVFGETETEIGGGGTASCPPPQETKLRTRRSNESGRARQIGRA